MTFKWELEIAPGNHSAHSTDMYGRTTEKARIAVTRRSLLTLDWTIRLFFVALISMPVGISTLIWPVPTGLGREALVDFDSMLRRDLRSKFEHHSCNQRSDRAQHACCRPSALFKHGKTECSSVKYGADPRRKRPLSLVMEAQAFPLFPMA